jgi:imidazolonepropionase
MLIRNGLIEDVGPARRVENLAGARNAREIDAAGRIVLPAFCDPDVALVAGRIREESEDRALALNLRIMSRKRVLAAAMATAHQCVRYGCLTVGSHTGYATDLKSILKLLRAHRAVQTRPLRIRSILSLRPGLEDTSAGESSALLETMAAKWMPAVRAHDLASVVEFTLRGPQPMRDLPLVRNAAIAAAEHGFTIRLRSPEPPGPALLQLALSTGALAILAPPDSLRAFARPLASLGCVRVIPMSAAFDETETAAVSLRTIINEGSAIALASGEPSRRGMATANMQFMLHLAVDRLGLTPEEAIVAATYNAACSLRMSHKTGSLEPGKSADFLIMDVPDYRELHRRAGHHDLQLAVRAGEIVWRSAALLPDQAH